MRYAAIADDAAPRRAADAIFADTPAASARRRWFLRLF